MFGYYDIAAVNAIDKAVHEDFEDIRRVRHARRARRLRLVAPVDHNES